MTKRRKILLSIVLPVVLLVFGLPWLLYVPAIQQLAVGIAVDYLNEQDMGMDFHVGSVHIGFPLRLEIRDVHAINQKNPKDTIASLGLLQTGLDDIPLWGKYFEVRHLDIQKAKFGFPHLTETLTLYGNIERLEVKDVRFNPAGELKIGEVLLPEPKVFVALGEAEPDTIDDDSETALLIAVEHLHLTDGKVGLRLDTARQAPGAFDYNHLRLDSLSVDVTDFVMNGSLIRARLNGLMVKERNSGLVVDELHTDFVMDQSQITARDFYLRMPATELEGNVDLDYKYFTREHQGNVNVELTGYVGAGDLKMHVMPYLPDMAMHWPDARTAVDVYVDAVEDTVRQAYTQVEVEQMLTLSVLGSAIHPWADSIRKADVAVEGSLRDADWALSAFVADSTRRIYRLPKGAEVEMSFKEAGDYLAATAHVEQEGRNVADVDASIYLKSESYTAKGLINRLDLGGWAPSLPVAELTAHLVASGRRFDLSSRYARLDAEVHVDSLYYWRQEEGYRGRPMTVRDSLKNIMTKASLLNHQYVVDVESQHPYLDFDTHLEGLYRSDTITSQGWMELRNADLANLPTGIKNVGAFSFQMDIDASYNWKNNADIHFMVDSLCYSDKGEVVHMKDMYVDVHSAADTLYALLAGGDAHVMVDMNCGVGQMDKALDPFLKELNRELTVLHIDIDTLQSLLPRINANIDMKQDNPFYPVLNYYGWGFDDMKVDIHNKERLLVDAKVDQLWGDGIDFDTLRLAIKPLAVGKGYDYDAHLVYIDPKPKNSYSAYAKGLILEDSLTLKANYINGRNVKLYELEAQLSLDGDTVTLRFGEDPIIYAQQLYVNHDNYVKVTNFRDAKRVAPGLAALLLMEGPNDLFINLKTSPVPTGGNEVHLNVSHLDLGYLRQTVKWEHQTGGILNLGFDGYAVPDSVMGQLNVGIGHLAFGEWSTDTVSLQSHFEQIFLNHFSQQMFDSLTKAGAELPRPDISSTLRGMLKIGEETVLDVDFLEHDSMRLDVTIDELPLPLANPFMPANMPLGGEAWGHIHMTQQKASKYVRKEGEEAPPVKLEAALAVKDGTVAYTDAGAMLNLPSDTLRLVDNYVKIDNYHIKADGNSPLTLNGWVDLRKDFTNPTLSLRIDGTDVKLFNNRRRNKAQTIAGLLIARPSIRVAGALSKLKVSGNVNVLSGTDLQYYLTDDPLASVSKTDEMVEFVRFSQLDAKMRIPKKYFETTETLDDGTTIDLKINIARDAKVYVNLGDQDNRIDIVGGGDLRFGSTADGTLTLNGNYNAHSGSLNYKLPVLPISKEFNIQDGSVVTFSGQMDAPDLNLAASENVRCTISDAASGTRVVNFVVYIYIKGTIKQMDITFNVTAPEDAAIQSQLNSLTDEERSRQAINLLVTQTYTGPGVTSNAGIASANAALNSLLQREVESLVNSQNALKHTQVSVGIDTYSTSSGSNRTDYSVKVSQGFFNDMMRVTVGGRMSSGADDEEVGRRSNAVINDVSIDWMLKKDGSNYVTLFRKTNYESVLEGEIVEMGGGYVLQREAMRFKDLFIFNTAARRKRIMERLKMLEAASNQNNENQEKK